MPKYVKFMQFSKLNLLIKMLTIKIDFVHDKKR